MKHLRTLWLLIAYFDISIKATHIPGTQNNSADHLSRNSMEKFRQLRPNMPLLPHPIPAPLLEMISLNDPDWTSPKMNALFQLVLKELSRPRRE